MKVRIFVLNYNGKDLLVQFLPSVVAAAQISRYPCRVTVVDNCSTDESVKILKEEFPSVEIFSAPKNEVLISLNDAVKACDEEVVILLNNDIKVKEDFIEHLVGSFKDDNVFFVAPQILNFDNTYNGGRSYLHFSFGVLKNIVDTERALQPGSTHSIATGAFRRCDFLKFGGFDRLYLPGIWEEVDLCYRALLSGKTGIYEPRSIIWHQESTTFNKEYGKRKKLIIAHRNMFLFCWKNIFDRTFIAQQVFFLLPRLIYALLTGKIELVLGFFNALTRFPDAFSRRRMRASARHLNKLKDRDIIR